MNEFSTLEIEIDIAKLAQAQANLKEVYESLRSVAPLLNWTQFAKFQRDLAETLNSKRNERQQLEKAEVCNV